MPPAHGSSTIKKLNPSTGKERSDSKGGGSKARGAAPMSMQKLYTKQVTQLDGLIELVREKLSSLQRRCITCLVTQDVHYRDIIEDLAEAKVNTLNNFKWQQQLRVYWDETVDDCVIRQVDARIMYGHEYQGAMTRLVITPLTDRCWMTITGALHISLGAAPAGPAGTGKTESTKDLAKGTWTFLSCRSLESITARVVLTQTSPANTHRCWSAMCRLQLLRSDRLQDDGQILLWCRLRRCVDMSGRV